MVAENHNSNDVAVVTSNGYEPRMFNAGVTLNPATKAQIADSVNEILKAIGPENLDPQGTERTPLRVAELFDELLSGYSIDPDQLLNGALFDVEYDQLVVVKSIEFYSLCEHHLLPFYGYAHVGYLPESWSVPRGVKGRRPLKNPPHRRYVRPTVAGAGAYDARDRQFPRLPHRSQRCRCGG